MVASAQVRGRSAQFEARRRGRSLFSRQMFKQILQFAVALHDTVYVCVRLDVSSRLPGHFDLLS